MFKKKNTPHNPHKPAPLQPDVEALLLESRRMLEESRTKDISAIRQTLEFSPAIKEIAENLSGSIQNYKDRIQYEIMKYKLANKALQTGLWDMEVIAGDPVNPDNTFIWSDEFRHMLGFTDQLDFPNKLNSWSDRLHPEDKDRTLEAFAKHLTDKTGKTPYNLEYRLKMKNGEYRYFQALGDTMRDSSGTPLRVAGLLRDINEHKEYELFTSQAIERIRKSADYIEEMNKMLHEFNKTIDSEAAAVRESAEVSQRIVKSLEHIAAITHKEQETIKDLTGKTSEGKESMRGTINAVQDISKSVDGIMQAIKIISSIAANTNLLSMNAAIEAAHAGVAGKGFAVVADEIRRLSENTRENSVNISRTLKNIVNGIAVTTKQSSSTESKIVEMSEEIDGFSGTISDLISTFNEMTEESSEITEALNALKEQSAIVKDGYGRMLAMTQRLTDAIAELTEAEERKLAG